MNYIPLLIATGTLALTTPIAEQPASLAQRSSVIHQELATDCKYEYFDDLIPNPVPALNVVPVPYKDLNFSSFVFQAAGTDDLLAGVLPYSAPNYAANGPLSPTRTPMFTVQGVPNAVSFDLHDFWYGCLDATETENVQLSTACTINVTGFKASNGAKVGPTAFSYEPDSLMNATMEEAVFESGFDGLSEATLMLTSSPATVEVAVLLVDSISYTVHATK